MATISHDAFARQELHRETVFPQSKGCDWCGNLSRDRYGKARLFCYFIEPDAAPQRRSMIRGAFCSIGCMRSHQG